MTYIKITLLLLCALLLGGTCLSAQSNYDIQFSLNHVDCMSETVCYNVQLRSNGGNSWDLAGQNYRLYYDGTLGSFQSGSSQLGLADYSAFTLVDDLQNQDATGAGGIAFENNLSFLNYSIDLTNTTAGGSTLPTDGSWLTTSQLCFNIDSDVLNDPSTCFEAIWARNGVSESYRTAFVEVAEWVSTDSTIMADGVGYNDLDATDGNAACLDNLCQSSENYDLQLSLDNVDCMSETVCYNVQLRSNDGNSWDLAGQNYRLYYDGALGSFQSGSTQLGLTDYSVFTLVDDLQNQDASGAGGISFEGNLSFLNYTIDLTNTATGGSTLPADGSWLTTSQLCFNIDSDVLNDPNTCFEAIWARDGVSESYRTAFVEVAEWVSPDSTIMADGVGYNDLDATDGNVACLDNLCQQSENYDIQLSLDNVDCMSETVCYNVQLRSNDGNSWNLAGQNYRLYYDGTLGSFQSGSTQLGLTDYSAFTLVDDLQNQDATGAGWISFEGNLSFLNYTIDLTNTATGGSTLPADGSWLTTSQLCFTIDSDVFNNPSTCFEAIWARDGVSESYRTAFVEVAEWVSLDSTIIANGVGYNDLDAADGGAACLSNLCQYDYGDLPDISAGTNTNDYQTLAANNGPAHQIIAGLALGATVDNESDGQPSDTALGDGADEDGIMMFASLDLYPGQTFRLPFSYTNTTGDTAHVEAWIDWNGDGNFEATEMVVDWDDSVENFPSIMEITIPADVKIETFLGWRIRISHQNNMTPYGIQLNGEIEDYLISVKCAKVCLPIEATIIR